MQGKSSKSVQCAITGSCLRMRHRPSAERTAECSVNGMTVAMPPKMSAAEFSDKSYPPEFPGAVFFTNNLCPKKSGAVFLTSMLPKYDD